MISGYTAGQVPCDGRTIYLPKKPFVVTPKMLTVALHGLNDTTHCANIDKALVIWEAIRETLNQGDKSLAPKVKNIGDLIEYNWARGNYQACVSLGYEQQCEIGEAAFQNLTKINFKSLGVTRRERSIVIKDIRSMPLRMAYTKVRKQFAAHDYLAAAEASEQLLQGFDNQAKSWEHINISKSRLYADAAVSWLHHGDSLTSTSDFAEDANRCASYEKALFNARRAQWFDFRQDHVPTIERRIRSCIQRMHY